MVLPLLLKNKKTQKGQALLIVLLLMAVSLTVVLSVVSRSVTEVTVSSVEEDSLRAFSAAEAGIEDALLSGIASLPGETPQSLDSTLPIESAGSYQRSIYPNTSDDIYIYPRELKSGETATFWFVSQDTDGNLTCTGSSPCYRGSQFEVCWGNTGASVAPAVEISVYYDDPSLLSVASPNDLSNIKVVRFAYDSVVGRSTNFDLPSGSNCDISTDFPYNSGKKTLTSPPISCPANQPCVIAISARLLYNETEPQQVGVWVNTAGGSQLPGQGIVIESTGRAGESTRKVNVFRSYAEIPSMFNASLFSGRDLIHQ